MKGFIARLAAWFRRSGDDILAPCAPEPGLDTDRREVARRLTQELDTALRHGRHDLADRIASSAMRIASMHPQLSDRIARLRLSQGNPETALRIIESCAWQSASIRLLRVTCLLMLGRRNEAHLDLRSWCQRAAAPLQARQLLALLEWRTGDAQAATNALLRNLKQIEDPMTLLMLALIGKAQQRNAWTGQWCERLHAIALDDQTGKWIEFALMTIGHQKAHQINDSTMKRRVQTLSRELVANEHVIPALVAGQRLRPDSKVMELLIAAIEHGLPSFEDQPAIKLALDQLRALSQQPHAFIEPRAADSDEPARDVLATIGTVPGDLRERAA